MTYLTEAIQFAAAAHEGAVRKGSSVPYILHPMEAAAITAGITDDTDAIIAALLHDTVEDAGVSPETIRQRFGENVFDMVMLDTETDCSDLPRHETWYDRKRTSLEKIGACVSDSAKAVILGDKLANLRAIHSDYLQMGDGVFERFNQKDKFMQGWYYRSFVELLASLDHTAAYKEYCDLCERVFGAGFDM
ncbi:MAG: HD domain-containing protein [Ruminococcaceae bacterium]|nr:HD domain-containing protein [Oscillospiraceae bacterium]